MVRITTICLALLLIFNIQWSFAQSDYEKGLKCLNEDRLACSLEAFESSYHNTKSDSSGYYLAITYYLLEDVEKSKSLLGDVLKKNPSYVHAAVFLSDIYYEQDDFKNAATTLSDFIESNPENCEAYIARAQLYLTEFEVDPFMAEDLEKSLFFCDDSTAVEALLLLGDVYFQLEEYVKARNVYDEVIELAPDQPKVLYDVASYQAEVGDYENAIDYFEKYKARRPDDSLVYFQLGFCYMAVEDYQGSTENFTEYIRKDSSDAEAWYNRGIAYGSNKDYNFAIRDLKRVLELDNEMDEALYNLAFVYQLKGEYSKAVHHYTEYITKNLYDPEAYYNRGLSKYYSDDEHGACTDWGKLTELGRRDLWKKVRVLCKDND